MMVRRKAAWTAASKAASLELKTVLPKAVLMVESKVDLKDYMMAGPWVALMVALMVVSMVDSMVVSTVVWMAAQ